MFWPVGISMFWCWPPVPDRRGNTITALQQSQNRPELQGTWKRVNWVQRKPSWIHTITLSPTTEQSVSPAAFPHSPNKTSPSTPLAYPQVNRTPSEDLGARSPVWGTIKKCTHTSPMCVLVLSLSSPPGETFCEILTLLSGLHQTWSC